MTFAWKVIGVPQFISDGRLQDAPKVRQLVHSLEPVHTSVACHTLLERFLNDLDIYSLPIINDERWPIALIDRKRFIEFFSKHYSREIFGNRTILELLGHEHYQNTEPLIVEEDCSVEDIARIIIDAGMQHMATGFIVCSQRRYLGVANGHDLLSIITQRKQAELYFLAHYDSLTGLPNRMLFNDRLQQACLDAERKGHLVALLFIDVDRFKQINDSLGHSFGDAVLRTVADRLKTSARRADTVARLGGDEFVILMEDLDDAASVDTVALRVVRSMREPIHLLGHSIVVTVSVGSALYPSDDTAISPLLAKADAAMYEAKKNGRDGFRKFSSGIAVYNPASKLMENELRQALERDELVLHFQPQVALASQEIRGFEVLVRWCHAERGLIVPGQFIAVAEESGLIVPLGEWVLHRVFRQIRTWREQGLTSLRLSINISALQFQQPGFPGFLKDRLVEYDVDPRLIEFELTESMLMQNAGDVLRTLEEIKGLGVRLAIDDFGTGFSSLSYLSRFPIDRLKIDQSFVRNVELSPANESITRAIVALANSLSLDIIAEGIETMAEHTVLKHLHCTEGQGYLFARPMPAAEVIGWIERHNTTRPVGDLFPERSPDDTTASAPPPRDPWSRGAA